MSSWLSSLGDTIKNSAEDLTRGVQGKETGRAESVVVTFEGSALGLTVSDHGGEGVLSALAPGGEAERLGLKLGDRVVAVGGAPTFKYPAAVGVLVVVEQYIFIASVDAIAFVRLQHQQRHSEGKLYI